MVDKRRTKIVMVDFANPIRVGPKTTQKVRHDDDPVPRFAFEDIGIRVSLESRGDALFGDVLVPWSNIKAVQYAPG